MGALILGFSIALGFAGYMIATGADNLAVSTMFIIMAVYGTGIVVIRELRK